MLVNVGKLMSRKKGGVSVNNQLSPSWTPLYSNIVQYFQFNGSGIVPTTVPAQIGNVGSNSGPSSSNIQYITPGYIPNWYALQLLNSGGSQAQIYTQDSLDAHVVNLNMMVKLITLNQYNPLCFCSQAGDWGIGFNNLNQLYVTDQNGTIVQSTATVSDTNWHMITVSFDVNANALFYIDSILIDTVDSSSMSLNNNGNGYSIGGDNNDGYYLSAYIDEFSIWEQTGFEFSQNDVNALYSETLDGEDVSTISLPDYGAGPDEYMRFQSFPNNPPENNDVVFGTTGGGGNISGSAEPSFYVPSIPGLQQALETNSNYITFSDTGFPTGNHSFSIGYWINGGPGALPPGGNICGGFQFGNIGTTYGAVVLGSLVNGAAQLGDHDGDGLTSGKTVMGDGNWHQVFGTYNSSTHVWTIYIDGANEGTMTGPTLNLTLSGIAYVNNTWGGFSGIFNIDEVALWNVCLTQAQIQTIYNKQKPA